MSVVSFPGAAVETAEPSANPKIIALLEKALADAKAGMIVAIGIATVRAPLGATRDVFEFGNDGEWVHQLVASTAYLHRDVTDAALDTGTSIETPVDPA